MTQDNSEFHAAFFEECLELLDQMESDLVALAPGPVDDDVMATLFRAAHSIKGGSATFNFTAISKLTHSAENFMDLVRNGCKQLNVDQIDLLLQSVDCVRTMIDELQSGTEVDQSEADQLGEQFHQLLEATSEPAPVKPQVEQTSASGEASEDELDALFDQVADQKGEASEEELDSLFDQVAEQQDQDPKIEAPQASKPVVAAPVKKPAAKSAESSSIRVATDKVDNLINMVGELVITQSMLEQVSEGFTNDKIQTLKDGLTRLQQNSRELQESVMQIRMQPVATIFNRFPRMVRDIAKKLNKPIELKISGETTELDKTVIEKISDPLVHIIRNSADHGIESPEIRKQRGKSETGVIHITAYHKGGNVYIQVTDDGGGIDSEKIREKAIAKGIINQYDHHTPDDIYGLLFHSGFSTAEKVTDVSGRGVGLDVVKRNIHDLGGDIHVTSTLGEGSSFTIRLPLTLAILEGQLFKIGEQVYVVPLLSMVETIQINPNNIERVGNLSKIYQLRECYMPIIELSQFLPVNSSLDNLTDGFLVIVNVDENYYALLIDELLWHQQVVIKSLEANYRSTPGISGATILGDGTIALILDVVGIIQYFNKHLSPTALQGASS